MTDDLAYRLTSAFYEEELDLSGRPGAPRPGWSGMPEVRAAERLEAAGAVPADLRIFLTLTTALDRARDSDRLWDAAADLWHEKPWAFDPCEGINRPSEVLAALKEYGVTQRHSIDGAAWLRIAHALAVPDRAPEVTGAVVDGVGDVEELSRALQLQDSDGRSLFPLLKGPKIGPLWLRILAYPGRASITGLAAVPVAVDTQVIRATRCLGVADVRGLSDDRSRDVAQRAWRDIVTSGGAVGPPGIANTCAALDPALWFWGKWGCSECEKRGQRIPIGDACTSCTLDSGAAPTDSPAVIHAPRNLGSPDPTPGQIRSPERELMTDPLPEHDGARRYDWASFNKRQVGRFGVEFAKTQLDARGFGIHQSANDATRTRFSVQRAGGPLFDVWVRTCRPPGGNYTFFNKGTFEPRESLLAVLVLLWQSETPQIFLIPSLAWRDPSPLLCDRDYEGKASVPEWGIQISGNGIPLLDGFRLEQQVALL